MKAGICEASVELRVAVIRPQYMCKYIHTLHTCVDVRTHTHRRTRLRASGATARSADPLAPGGERPTSDVGVLIGIWLWLLYSINIARKPKE